jgi:transcriptional regulator with XRE-family HTH domain
MKKDLPPLARTLKTARAKAGMSQHELATQSGVARVTIANIELGNSLSIRSSTAAKLAQCLGMTTAEFMQGGQTPPQAGHMGSIDQALETYQESRRGTVMVATTQEIRWLRQILGHWGQVGFPSDSTILFFLLGYRHRSNDR